MRKSRESMRYILVKNPKPSGSEVLPKEDKRYNQHSTQHALREDKTSAVLWHHEETGYSLSDRCILHAELAGEYNVSPAQVELMYQTEIRGHSGTFHFVVEDEADKVAMLQSRHQPAYFTWR